MMVDGNFVPKIDKFDFNVKQYFNINSSTPWILSIVGGPLFGTAVIILSNAQNYELSKQELTEYKILGNLQENQIIIKE